MNQDDSTRRRLQEQAAMAHVNQQRAMLDKEEFRDEVSKAMKEALDGISAEAQLDDKVKTLLESADSTISDLLETVEAKDVVISALQEELGKLCLEPIKDLITIDQAVDFLAREKMLFKFWLWLDCRLEAEQPKKPWWKFWARKKD